MVPHGKRWAVLGLPGEVDRSLTLTAALQAILGTPRPGVTARRARSKQTASRVCSVGRPERPPLNDGGCGAKGTRQRIGHSEGST
jgi:hypothetical protein